MKKPEIEMLSLPDLMKKNRALPPLKKIWGDLVGEAQLIHFPAERGCGKTLLLMQLLFAIANCMAVLCGMPILSCGPVVYLNFEIPSRLLADRQEKMFGKQNGQTKHRYEFITAIGQTYNQVLEEIEKTLKEIKPLLIVIDSWQIAFSDKDNNKASETASAVMQLRALAEKYNCAIIVADHLRKGTKYDMTDSDLQSGSGVKSNFFDQDFFLRRSTQDKSMRLLSRSKYRYSAEEDGATLIKLDPESLWFDLIQQNVDETEHLISPAMTKALREVRSGVSIRDAAKNNGISKSGLHRRL